MPFTQLKSSPPLALWAHPRSRLLFSVWNFRGSQQSILQGDMIFNEGVKV